MKEMRKRIAIANAAAVVAHRLGNRTRAAMDVILSSSSLTHVLKAVTALGMSQVLKFTQADVSTRYSTVCTTVVVQQGAVPVLYNLIKSCNSQNSNL